MNLLRNVLTGPDNFTFDEIKMAFMAAVAALIMFTGYGVLVQHRPFATYEFCGGFAALATASGLTSSAKQLSGAMPAAAVPAEPKDTKTTTTTMTPTSMSVSTTSETASKP